MQRPAGLVQFVGAYKGERMRDLNAGERVLTSDGKVRIGKPPHRASRPVE